MDIEIAKTIEEAGGWEHHNNMGLGSCVAHSAQEDRYYLFLHEESRLDLQKLLNGKRVVTYNGVRFDSKVLLGEDRTIKEHGENGILVSNKDNTIQWVEFDIFLNILKAHYNIPTAYKMVTVKKFDKGFTLDAIAKATLGNIHQKTGHGGDAPLLYQKSIYSQLLEYNLQDTALTKKLFDFINKNDYVNHGLTGKRINLNLRRNSDSN